MNKPILVFYIDVRKIPQEDLPKTIDIIRRSLYNNELVTFVIPLKGETRVECVNPILATEEEYNKIKQLIEEYQEKLNNLN